MLFFLDAGILKLLDKDVNNFFGSFKSFTIFFIVIDSSLNISKIGGCPKESSTDSNIWIGIFIYLMLLI